MFKSLSRGKQKYDIAFEPRENKLARNVQSVTVEEAGVRAAAAATAE